MLDSHFVEMFGKDWERQPCQWCWAFRFGKHMTLTVSLLCLVFVVRSRCKLSATAPGLGYLPDAKLPAVMVMDSNLRELCESPN